MSDNEPALTLEALQLIDAIVRHGSFAQAARALGRVPSAVTYSVRRLEEDLDVLLFDRRGHRIGYGAGYYDLTINRVRSLKQVAAVGIAFAAQEVAAVPDTPRDARLDLVLTEREVIDFRTA